jgi:hypothetical protein
MRWIVKGGDKATSSWIFSVDEPIEQAELETLNINRKCGGGKLPARTPKK